MVKDTKKLIKDTALDMFAKRGYNSVSIRDICGVVGIKESSLYYHFVNKQAILDALLSDVSEFVEIHRNNFDVRFAEAKEVSIESMCAVAAGFVQIYLCDPLIYRMIAILTIERMADERAAEEYQRIVFDLPLEQQTRVFTKMIERGFIKENDPVVLAEEYYSIIYFAFQRHCLGGELTEERKYKAFVEISSNIGDIYRKMI